MVQWLLPILKNLGFQVSDAPTTIHEDILPTIDIIKVKHIIIRVKYIYVTINYFHEIYVLLTIYPVNIKTNIQPAYIGTKISTYTLLERQYYYICGTHYYPPY